MLFINASCIAALANVGAYRGGWAMADEQDTQMNHPDSQGGGDTGGGDTTGADVSVDGNVTTIDMPPETITANPDDPAPPPPDPVAPPLDPNYHGPEVGPADPNSMPYIPPDPNFNEEGKFDPLRVLGDHVPEEF